MSEGEQTKAALALHQCFACAYQHPERLAAFVQICLARSDTAALQTRNAVLDILLFSSGKFAKNLLKILSGIVQRKHNLSCLAAVLTYVALHERALLSQLVDAVVASLKMTDSPKQYVYRKVLVTSAIVSPVLLAPHVHSKILRYLVDSLVNGNSAGVCAGLGALKEFPVAHFESEDIRFLIPLFTAPGTNSHIPKVAAEFLAETENFRFLAIVVVDHLVSQLNAPGEPQLERLCISLFDFIGAVIRCISRDVQNKAKCRAEVLTAETAGAQGSSTYMKDVLIKEKFEGIVFECQEEALHLYVRFVPLLAAVVRSMSSESLKRSALLNLGKLMTSSIVVAKDQLSLLVEIFSADASFSPALQSVAIGT
eukprot:TRINITY_DN2367_c0_g1_i2.p1 TRINITY_DN2367_c0_g1~~TRINITY_DN2367_c0_g1_i2.p1  ORF type:complete len:368 (+),score=37.30 TRINITY_DN2367_c0_g1_i2:442-1545(+)